jgi:hypothetical protein
LDLRSAEEREVILLETCVQKSRAKESGGMARFKSALIGMSHSAPIRDR